MTLEHKKDWGPGYRSFVCECGYAWSEKSRHCESLSGVECPSCNDFTYPAAYDRHYEWPTDAAGNLIDTPTTVMQDLVRTSMEVRREKQGGVPCLKGTRMPVGQLIAEILDTATGKLAVAETCAELKLDIDQVNLALLAVANTYSQPMYLPGAVIVLLPQQPELNIDKKGP